MLFYKGVSAGVRVVLLMALAISMMILDHHTPLFQSTRAVLAEAVSPWHQLVDTLAHLGPAMQSSFTFDDQESLQDQLDEMNIKVFSLQAQLLKMRALKQENRRLRALLKADPAHEEGFIYTEIVRSGEDPFHHLVHINRGREQGVVVGDMVIDAFGLFGQVLRVHTRQSEVLLITDPSHTVPVQVARNGLQSLLRGTAERDRLILPYLPNQADIKPGDVLISSGLGGRFSSGYPVATVTRVARHKGSPFAEVSARPQAHLYQSRSVLLVKRSREPVL